ncbi:MFS transporter [Cysteiniphilum sp. SYW-8]|uniref:MFS transporter n=1 Tax=Cysteiniphilum sp. SYW-8 TaxID=2610890 RepID=UPI001CD142D8|nr:MFS transporter [Cysteiniphilum sp. SYW-8]
MAVSLGNIFETYDFVLYGMLAPTFSVIFFPEYLNTSTKLILSYLLFFCAYLTRPIGGIVWGYIGDKYGRKRVLTSTVIIMLIAATSISILPAYEKIGLFAPIILIVIRVMQGIAFAGEFPTVMVSLYELSSKKNKGFLCSFTETISLMGNMLGTTVCIVLLIILDSSQFNSFGWRIPFFLSILFIFVVYYIRMNFIETLIVKVSDDRVPLLINFRENLYSILKIIFFLSTNSFLLFSFVYYSGQTVGNHSYDGLYGVIFPWLIEFVCVLLLVLLYPYFGMLSDRIGIKNLSLIGHILILVFYYPIYSLLLQSTCLWLNILGIVFTALCLSALATSYIPIIVEMANQACRISVVSLGWGLSVILFGASAPAISEILRNLLGLKEAPAFYMLALSLISIAILLKTKKSFN